MLSQLYIENIAVIEKAEIDFRSGLNVLTGETGAGKSILIDSIHAILGERISKELVRTGAKTAFVSAGFESISKHALGKAKDLGCFPEEDGSFVIQREIHADGKTVCRINGRLVTVSVLKEIGAFLINIHGQHENYGLLAPEHHIFYLDHMGGLEALYKQYQTAYEAMREIKLKLDSLQMDEAQKARQMDLLSYQIQELEDADLHSGEQEELLKSKNIFRNSEKIALSLTTAKSAIDGDENSEGALAEVINAADALNNAERYLPDVHELSERLRNIAYDLEDCSGEMRNFSSELEYDPAELEKIENRLDTIYRLSLKYGSTVDDMLSYLQNCKAELKDIQLSDEKADKLAENYNKANQTAQNLALKLSAKRSETIKLFEDAVKTQLEFLDMPNLTFLVEQEHCEINANGCDKIQFLISTNPGEPPKPISKIASGGELSRIMLAIKTVLADTDDLDTMIFDEIDTGISGSAAQKVGLKLREVSASRQVICVTHLAQIAALANHHFLIQKHTDKDRTFTNVIPLDFNGRKQELARIIGGVQITDITLKNAEEMLHLAKQ